jgi:hypothetical protein
VNDYLERVRTQLVDTSQVLHARRRRRWPRRGLIASGVVVLVGAPALAATGVWRPPIGDGAGPAPQISEKAPPADQLALLGVLRRPQTAADRGAASQSALQLLNSPSIEGVRTNSVRLLVRSPRDRGVVLVPVVRYAPEAPPLPADTPSRFARPSAGPRSMTLCVCFSSSSTSKRAQA